MAYGMSWVRSFWQLLQDCSSLSRGGMESLLGSMDIWSLPFALSIEASFEYPMQNIFVLSVVYFLFLRLLRLGFWSIFFCWDSMCGWFALLGFLFERVLLALSPWMHHQWLYALSWCLFLSFVILDVGLASVPPAERSFIHNVFIGDDGKTRKSWIWCLYWELGINDSRWWSHRKFVALFHDWLRRSIILGAPTVPPEIAGVDWGLVGPSYVPYLGGGGPKFKDDCVSASAGAWSIWMVASGVLMFEEESSDCIECSISYQSSHYNLFFMFFPAHVRLEGEVSGADEPRF